MKEILEKLFAAQRLNQSEIARAVSLMLEEKASLAQIAAFLSAYRMREPEAEELSFFRAELLSRAQPLKLNSPDLFDLCGTGGDHKNTFNISTIACFVLGASGVPLAKHGNYGFSSSCGSSNLLEALQVPLAKNEAQAQSIFNSCGLVFLHAPYWHPSLKVLADLRKALAIRTIFNALGPLLNPARPNYLQLGVYPERLMQTYAKILSAEKINFCLTHSLDGYDEISLTAEALVLDKLDLQKLSATDFGLKKLDALSLKAEATPELNAKLALSILGGKGSAAQEAVVLATAALGLKLFKAKLSLLSAMEELREVLKSGKALLLLQKLQQIKLS